MVFFSSVTETSKPEGQSLALKERIVSFPIGLHGLSSSLAKLYWLSGIEGEVVLAASSFILPGNHLRQSLPLSSSGSAQMTRLASGSSYAASLPHVHIFACCTDSC